jgi:hypothetical protein
MDMDILPTLKPGKIIIAFGFSSVLATLLAELALTGPVTVMDGGNQFPAYRIAHEIRKRSTYVKEVSARLFLRRAFTAYQAVHLLESAPAIPHPHILLNLLTTFEDEQIKPQEADRLLTLCLLHLERLSVSAPIAVCLEPRIVEEKAFLLKRLTDRSDQTIFLTEASLYSVSQPPLFI